MEPLSPSGGFPRDPAQHLTRLEAVCSAQGRPLTSQRRLVLATLCASKSHPTADDVYRQVRQQLPAISRATVYRTLETFVDLGVATRVGHPGVSMRFDARTDRHHHLLCEDCGSLSDVEADQFASEIPSVPGARVREFTVLFLGTCSGCANEA